MTPPDHTVHYDHLYVPLPTPQEATSSGASALEGRRAHALVLGLWHSGLHSCLLLLFFGVRWGGQQGNVDLIDLCVRVPATPGGL